MSIDPAVQVHERKSGEVTELYITARPQVSADAQSQAATLLDSVADVLRSHGAHILQERIFADPAAMETLSKTRAKSFADFANGIDPTWLAVPPNSVGPVSGVQVHALAGCGRPEVLSLAGKPSGRRVSLGSWSYLIGCNLQSDDSQPPAGQARAMLGKAEALLSEAGGTLANISRTWMWLGNILDWYDDFNRVRNELFKARGLLREGGAGTLPASTGIGIGPWGQRCCTMDFCAVLGDQKPQFLLAGGNQDAASKYNSAFSRAAVSATPAGKTVYVSGTAAIDSAGQTTHIGDVLGQIEDTVANVNAVLRNASCGPDDVVSAVAYCKTPQVERTFRNGWGSLLRGPYVVALADVCRDNLLFEIEATAIAKA
jgi:enamine deaminase RidA (YjgF/YER057c/UK114 family)